MELSGKSLAQNLTDECEKAFLQAYLNQIDSSALFSNLFHTSNGQKSKIPNVDLTVVVKAEDVICVIENFLEAQKRSIVNPDLVNGNMIRFLAYQIYQEYVRIFTQKVTEISHEKLEKLQNYDIEKAIREFDDDFNILVDDMIEIYELLNNPIADALIRFRESLDEGLTRTDKNNILDEFEAIAEKLKRNENLDDHSAAVLLCLSTVLEKLPGFDMVVPG